MALAALILSGCAMPTPDQPAADDGAGSSSAASEAPSEKPSPSPSSEASQEDDSSEESTGESSSESSDESSSESTEDPSGDPTDGSSDEPSDESSQESEASQGALNGDELAALLDTMNTDLEIGGIVLNEVDLKDSVVKAAAATKNAKYSPCNPTEGTDTEKAAREASMAALVVDGNEPTRPDTISAISWPTEDPVLAEIEASRTQLETCPEFTITVNGQDVSSISEGVEIDQIGDASQAYSTRTTANGVTQTTVTLTAWQGTNSASITLNEAGDAAEAVYYTAPILEDVLKRMEGNVPTAVDR